MDPASRRIARERFRHIPNELLYVGAAGKPPPDFFGRLLNHQRIACGIKFKLRYVVAFYPDVDFVHPHYNLKIVLPIPSHLVE
eukprot:SAG31_NODE_1510_length_8062_cov_4.204194_5_plen_83_part_00